VRVDFSPEALADLDTIFDYIAVDKPQAALRWVEKLIDRAEAAGEHPRAGRVVAELGDATIREVFLRNYRILYRVEKKRLLVLTSVEGHRRPPRR
jgi:toxin ParE1/3/4